MMNLKRGYIVVRCNQLVPEVAAILLASVIQFFFPSPSNADMLRTEEYLVNGQRRADSSMTAYIGSNVSMCVHVADGDVEIRNMSDNTFTFYNTNTKVFYTATAEEHHQEMRAQCHGMPEATGSNSQNKVSIKAYPAFTNVLGFPVDRDQLWVDGALAEEVWFATNLVTGAFMNMTNVWRMDDASHYYVRHHVSFLSGECRTFMTSHDPFQIVRQITYSSPYVSDGKSYPGSTDEWVTTSIRIAPLDRSVFAVPAGYTKVIGLTNYYRIAAHGLPVSVMGRENLDAK
jgi:hypothetical protein